MSKSGPIVEDSPQDELSVLEIAIALAKHKQLLLGLPALAGILAAVVVLLLPNTYTADARILPPQQKESSVAMLSVLAGATGGAGGASLGQALGLRNPGDLYAGILRSNTIGDRLIDRFNLEEQYGASTRYHARRALENVTAISAGKDGLITISVDDGDPQRAADIANAYIEELDRLMQGLALSEAAQRRLFFEKQLTASQNKLVTAEAALRRAIDAKGITEVDAQTRALLTTTEQLRAQIAAKEIQLDSMRAYATESNPDAIRLRQEIKSMGNELQKLEGGRGTSTAHRSPAGLENIRKLRDVKFLEFTVQLLTKQYEIARIDEAKDAVLIQIVDKALPPDYKSAPRRGLIVLTSVLAFGFVGMLSAIFLEMLAKTKLDPIQGKQLDTLRQHLRSFRAKR